MRTRLPFPVDTNKLFAQKVSLGEVLESVNVRSN